MNRPQFRPVFGHSRPRRLGLQECKGVTSRARDASEPHESLCGPGAYRLDHFGIFRKAPLGVLRKDQRAVDGDVEHTAVPARQVRVDAKLSLECGRQTGGLGKVVSTSAVRNRDLHRPHSNVGQTHPAARAAWIVWRTRASLAIAMLQTSAS